MTPVPPPVDRAAASRAAVAARRGRAEVKRAIAGGQRTPLEVLAASLDAERAAEHSLRVTEFLLAIPHIGVTKMHRILEQLAISPAKRLGGLGIKQRARLEEYLQGWAAKSAGRKATLTVLAGPTAVGKGAVSAYLREHYPQLLISVSATTRPPRPGEQDGRDYHFIDDATFDRWIEEGEFLEHATVHNRYRYGTPRAPIRQAIAEGTPVLLEIDLQGARQVRHSWPGARLVFLLPPSWDELVRRLLGRGTESPEEQERRLQTAKQELAAQDEFDHLVVNDTVPEAAQRVMELIGLQADGAEQAPPRSETEEQQ